MACSEITLAIQWLQSATPTQQHAVIAYFTKHFGYGAQSADHKDAVHYAIGGVGLNNQPKPHLKGTIKCYTNDAADEGMSLSSSVT